MSSKTTWTIVVIAVIVIIAAWFFLDHSSGYPKSPEDILNASSTSSAYDASNAAASATSTGSPSFSVSASPSSAPNTNTSSVKNLMHNVTIETSKGNIVFQTYDADAPKTVENFITLADKSFYNGLIFHRVINGFMIQGGDPTGTGSGGPGYQFADELNASTDSYKAGYARGTVAMANSGPNTNGSQFFIMQKDNPLPHNYTIFGKVISGMDVVDAIANVKTSAGDRPVQDVVMKKVTVKNN